MSYTMIDETAITSPDPVLINVIAIIVIINTLPVLPSNRAAMKGVTRPIIEEQIPTLIYVSLLSTMSSQC